MRFLSMCFYLLEFNPHCCPIAGGSCGNALILAAFLKKTFPRTPFHILLSGLAFTDLCTGLIAQPFVASKTLVFLCSQSQDSHEEANAYTDN